MRQTGPPVTSGAEFELMVQHPAAYFKITPVTASFLERLVQMSTSPLLSPRGGVNESTNASAGKAPATNTTPPVQRLAQTRPAALPRGEYCDVRLQQLDMGTWTCVPVENEFAAAVLSNYLENDHLVSGFFDADIVLDDLVNNRTQFCSPFLLSSLLFLACVSLVRRASVLLLIEALAIIYRYRCQSVFFGLMLLQRSKNALPWRDGGGFPHQRQWIDNLVLSIYCPRKG